MAQNNKYVGRQIGNYRIVKEMARGGFGCVYLAQHVFLTERTVVIKMLHQIYLGSQQEQEDFMQEAQILEKLKHSYILPILDVGIHEETPYLITEYAQHGSLRQRLQRYAKHPIAPDEAMTMLAQMGQALHHAHAQNVIHRDLKPENILFNARDEALLADFGISTVLTTASVKLTNVIGTPAYMAPEQFRGIVSKESDQYALGCLAYELFTGRPPFDAPDFVSLGFKHATETPIPLRQFDAHLPSHVEQAILKAMAKEREDRYPSVMAFIGALRAVSVDQAVPASELPTVAVPQHALAPAPAMRTPATRKPPLVLPSYPDEQETPPVPAPAEVRKPRQQQQQQQQQQQPRRQKKRRQRLTPVAKIEDDYTAELVPKNRSRIAGWSYLVPLLEIFVVTPALPVVSALMVHLLVSVIALFFLRGKSHFVRFHVMQSILFFLWMNLIGLLIWVILALLGGPASGIASIASLLACGILLILLIVVVAAFRGKYIKLPFIGKQAEKFAHKSASPDQ